MSGSAVQFPAGWPEALAELSALHNLTLVQSFLSTNFCPPPPPPQKKLIFSFRGLRIKKIHWGIVLLGKIMILQGVGHQTSCLGVCYANDPPKGGGGIQRLRLRLI